MIETREEIFLVMEFAERGDLMQYVRSREKLDEPQAATLFLQIMEAIEYIHSVGVAHRDIKPTNILLTKDLQVKLADFGLSNTYKPGGKLSSSCGSPCYAAPEIIEAKLYDPLAADTWSLGVVLFFMVSGFLPFQHKNTHTLYKLILRGKCEVPASVSKLAGDLIYSLLRVLPTRRLRPSEIKSHPWLRLHTGRQEILGEIRQREQSQQTLNDEAVKLLLRMGFDTEHLPELLQKRRHTKVVTIYHLLCLKTK
jgi:5'-AMP-activated protein kinase catalytic alpha subunit